MSSERDPLALPPLLDVVPLDVAHTVIDEVTAAVNALQRQLDRLRADADDVEARAQRLPDVEPVLGSIGSELLNGADGLVAAARSYASTVVEEARAHGQEIVNAAERDTKEKAGDRNGASTAAVLHLAPVDRHPAED